MPKINGLPVLYALEKGNESFAFETTLSGKSYLKRIKRLQQNDWFVSLFYLVLPSAEVSVERVAERLAHGGHHIPSADICRRFPKSLNRFYNDFLPLVDYSECILNEKEPLSIFKSFKEGVQNSVSV